MGHFEQTVGKGTFSVIYMGNYAKISDILHSFIRLLGALQK